MKRGKPMNKPLRGILRTDLPCVKYTIPTFIYTSTDVDEGNRLTDRLLRAARCADAVGRRGGSDGRALPRTRRSDARPHRQRADDERPARVRLRARRAARSDAADREPP